MIVLIAAPETMSYLRYAALLVMVQSYCSLVVLWAWILTAFPSTLSHRGAHVVLARLSEQPLPSQ